MKKYLFLAAACLATLFLGSVVFCAQEANMPASPAPTLLQLVGTTEATLGPTIYPEFESYKSDNATCGEYLKKPYSQGGFSLAPLWAASTYGNGQKRLASDPGYTLLTGLKKTNFVIPDAYRNTSKLLVTWTVRVEGYKKSYPVRGILCSNWWGTSYQNFPEGHVYTKLYVNGEPMGERASLTIPPAGKSTVVELPPPPHDPTLTGSCLLTPEDFGGSFPDRLTLEIRWYNDSAMDLKSPANMRNLIVSTMPISGSQDQNAE